MEDKQVRHSFKIAGLITKYINKSLEPQEEEELMHWAELTGANKQQLQKLSSGEGQALYIDDLNLFDTKTALQKVKLQIQDVPIVALKKTKIKWVYPVAAAILAIISISIWMSANRGIPGADIAPAGNVAVLTLSNGKKIPLNHASNGKLAEQNGISIRKAKDGTLIYEISAPQDNGIKDQYNTIQTPKGGTYQVNLPDGTKVWLNAESSLHFPVRFSTQQRRVELKGEGYFEVAKDKTKPFLVCTTRQQVEVLGTHFNINAYPEDASEQTSLVEGSVKVIDSKTTRTALLKPGEKSILTDQGLKVSPAGIEEDIAWKNGSFLFNELELSVILKQLSRWYNIEVDYSQVPKTTYTGFMSRDVKLSVVLKYLEVTGKVKFKIENRILKTIK